MFGLFKSPPYSDSLFGELTRTRGIWRGVIELGGVKVPLAIHGPRSAPDPQAIEMARAIGANYPEWQKLIAAAMFEHFSPYAEALAEGECEPPEEGFPSIGAPDQVWPYTSVEFVSVMTLGGDLIVEIGYRVAWDEEHTLGARLENGRLIELNGSILPP